MSARVRLALAVALVGAAGCSDLLGIDDFCSKAAASLRWRIGEERLFARAGYDGLIAVFEP